ncbi:response regulator transcription factor [Paenibacillus taiwanensis]|uniref:response regulator transcription factor n=1 Tax=Paenibacillus taiwanensis TaxID=401638 RepID=UPI0003FA866A|nr:response regulator transcription factor [Paenibacillus taiwanensis]
MSHRILIMEDDHEIVDMLKQYLVKEGYVIDSAYDGQAGMVQFVSTHYELVVVDIMMPKLDGIEVIKQIRERSAVPILIMSAKDSDVDKALGLGFGADDYIAKPFSMIEIAARIKAAIRRSTVYANREAAEPSSEFGNPQVYQFGHLRVDVGNFAAFKEERELRLTSKEFDILKLFITNPNRVFTKAQIYGFVWQDDYYGDENVINVHIRRLREKIEDNPSEPRYIKTLWGIGYKWEG